MSKSLASLWTTPRMLLTPLDELIMVSELLGVLLMTTGVIVIIIVTVKSIKRWWNRK